MNNGTSNVIICDFNGITNKWIVRKIDYYKSSDRFTAIILPESYTAQQKEIPIDLPKDSSDKDILRIVSMRLQEYLGQRFPANASFEMFREPIIRTSALCCKLNSLVVAFVLPLFSLIAETETINGIEWSYYVEDGYAVLEHPNARSRTTVPSPTHSGQLSDVLQIPGMLGGAPVAKIGVAAIQLPEGSVHTIIVPSSVVEVSAASFCGLYKYLKGYNDGSREFYFYPCPATVFFLGNKPSGLYGSNKWTCGTYHGSPVNLSCHIDLGAGCDIMAVEGMEGWIPNQWWVQFSTYGYVRYGAAKVDMYPIDGICQTGTISLSCTNKSAVLRYTIDGSEPVTNDAPNCYVYEGPIPIARKTTVKVIACVANYPYTVTYTKVFALGKVQALGISASQPLFDRSGNNITFETETANAEIRYTLDGSEPTEMSRLYTGPFTIDDTTTVKAKAFKEDWFESETATATFTREWYTVDAPVIEPSGAEFANISQTVSLSCETDGATILYTTDGSDPKVNGREYTKPFAIYKSCTVRAIAVKYDWKDSAEVTATFTRGETLSEAANFYGYTMETDSAAPWTVDAAVSHDGVSSVRSGAIGNNGTTYLMASVKKAGTVSFWWKAQCEEPDEEDGEDGYYDYGAFLVDDAVKARIAGNDTGWRFVSVEVPTGGKHVLRWEYRKDGATSYAPDCVWVDQVQWIPADGSGYTLTSPEPVPYSWLRQYNLGVASGDFEAAANAASGKTQGGAATSVWEEFVAGTDPTNALSVFTAKIEMQGATPLITWEPDLNTNGVVRAYKVYGRETLVNGGEWQYPTNSLHRFFKVTVEMP